MSRKNKFDLTQLVKQGLLKDGEMVFFVSDPGKSAKVFKMPNGEYKLLCAGEKITVHAAAQQFLGQEPPNHAACWLRNQSGKTLFDLWKSENDEKQAA